MYGPSSGTKKGGRCREVAASGGSTVLLLRSVSIVLMLFHEKQEVKGFAITVRVE